MLIGYTLLDPLVVIIGTGISLYFLCTQQIKLIAFLPMALSFYFFLPFITLMTLWQTVPVLLILRFFLKGKISAPLTAKNYLLLFLYVFLCSALYSLIAGDDKIRTLIRMVYYAGIVALFSFSYEMGRHKNCYKLFIKGLVVTGAVLAIYGLYQIVADKLDFPIRGILRGTDRVDMAYEYGMLRINSLTNEPKRLGYVLFVCGIACFFLDKKTKRVNIAQYSLGLFILFMSVFTFSGSYFLSVFLFFIVFCFLYPSTASKYLVLGCSLIIVFLILSPDIDLFEALLHGYDRREQELEVGLNGAKVYRQEFYGWDFLKNSPWAIFGGVGLGQYYSVLFAEYGVGVGINEYGGLAPLNSTLLELIFDFGIIAAVLFYGSLALIMLRLYKRNEKFLFLAILFLTLQSFTILTIQFLALFSGIAIAKISKKDE